MINFIPKGKANAIKRKDLANITGKSDRKARQMVVDLQNEGYPIVNAQDGTGYYIATSEEELDRYHAQERSRAISGLAKIRRQKQNLKREYFEVDA